MKLGIDCRPFFSGSKYRGIGMYARGLVDALQRDERTQCHFLNLYGKYEGDPELADDSILHDYFVSPMVLTPDVGEGPLFGDERAQPVVKAQVEHFLKNSGVDAMLFTSPNEYGGLYRAEWFEGVFRMAIFYDLIPLIYPERYLSDERVAEDYNRSLEFIKGMDLLLAISQSAKDDAVRLLGIPPEKIVVIYAGLSPMFQKKRVDKRILRERFSIKGDFILFAGGIDFKKNIDALIEAYAHLPGKYIRANQLVVAGRVGGALLEQFRATARKNGVASRVIFTDFISDEELVALYNETKLLVFPSLYEGFGLPVIEAMACGTPVVTSDCSSLGEIAKGYATLVDPSSVAGIGEGMKAALANPGRTRALAQKAMDYARGYTWEKTAGILLSALEERRGQSRTRGEAAPLEVTDALLRDLSELYADHRIVPSHDDMVLLGEELDRLERQVYEPARPRRRILYDMTAVLEGLQKGKMTGIGRVAYCLYRALGRYALPVPIAVDADKPVFTCRAVDPVHFSITQNQVIPRAGDIYLMSDIRVRGVHVPQGAPRAAQLREIGVRCYAVLYDLLPIQFPQYFPDFVGEGFHGYIRELAENYDGILSDSRTVSDELEAYCRARGIVPDHPVHTGWFHLGVDSFAETSGRIPYAAKPFFGGGVYLMVGTVEPRKGHRMVLDAFERLWAAGGSQKLCVVGREGWKVRELMQRMRRHPELGRRLALFDNADDVLVRYAYEHSTALIQASEGEGFGLPLIEAGGYALPVLCTDIPVFREVAGGHALYFESGNPQSLLETIERFERLRDQGKAPKSQEIATVTWNDSAKKVCAMIAEDRGWHSMIGNET